MTWELVYRVTWAQALLLDCMTLDNPITLAYNSAHVPPLFNYKQSLAFPATALKTTAAPPAAAAAAAAAQQGQPGVKAEPGTEGGAGAGGAPVVKEEQGALPGTGGPAAPMAVDAAAAPPPLPGNAPADPAAGVAEPVVPAPPAPAAPAAAGAAAPMDVDGAAGAGGGGGAAPEGAGAAAPELDVPLPPALRALLEGQVEFLRENDKLRGAHLVSQRMCSLLFGLLYSFCHGMGCWALIAGM